jgi:hypothetical protein
MRRHQPHARIVIEPLGRPVHEHAAAQLAMGMLPGAIAWSGGRAPVRRWGGPARLISPVSGDPCRARRRRGPAVLDARAGLGAGNRRVSPAMGISHRALPALRDRGEPNVAPHSPTRRPFDPLAPWRQPLGIVRVEPSVPRERRVTPCRSPAWRQCHAPPRYPSRPPWMVEQSVATASTSRTAPPRARPVHRDRRHRSGGYLLSPTAEPYLIQSRAWNRWSQREQWRAPAAPPAAEPQ